MSDWEDAVDSTNPNEGRVSAGHNGFGDDDGFGGFGGSKDVGGDGSKTCNNCGKEGHFKRDCPEIPEDQRGPGACFNCGEIGHNKTDCPNPRVFKGTCRICDEEGHPARECPSRPAEVCKNCGDQGHAAQNCEKDRKLDFSEVKTVDANEAWARIEQASKDRDFDDFREAIMMYRKAVPELTYDSLEEAFRQLKLNFYIIALDKPVDEYFTIMDLQGKLDRKYVVGYFLSPRVSRKSMVSMWPPSPEENMERLKNAGVVVDRFVLRCYNCDELGHTTKTCTQERAERKNRDEIVCSLCEEVGHRMRDCKKERIDRYACRNCNKRGHDAKECPEPRNPANVICKNCDKKGHFARDCPDRPPEICHNCGEEGHRSKECSVVKCRNCDALGHVSKECPKPRDYSRVKCKNCGEMGHTQVRCKQPIKAEEDDGFGNDDWNNKANSQGNTPAEVADDW